MTVSRSRPALLTVAAVLFASCAAALPPPPPPTLEPAPGPTPAPRADLWDAPRAVLSEAGYTVTDEDRAKGMLTARLVEATGTAAEQKTAIAMLRRIADLDDPRVGGAAAQMSEYAITVQVRIGSAESAEVSMAVKAEFRIVERVRREGAVKELAHPVPSRGVLEQELIEKIRRQLEK